MKSFQQLCSEYDIVSGEMAALSDILAEIHLRINKGYATMEEINYQMDIHPDKPQDERFENHREPEDRIWRAMMGGTDGG